MQNKTHTTESQTTMDEPFTTLDFFKLTQRLLIKNDNKYLKSLVIAISLSTITLIFHVFGFYTEICELSMSIITAIVDIYGLGTVTLDKNSVHCDDCATIFNIIMIAIASWILMLPVIGDIDKMIRDNVNKNEIDKQPPVYADSNCPECTIYKIE